MEYQVEVYEESGTRVVETFQASRESEAWPRFDGHCHEPYDRVVLRENGKVVQGWLPGGDLPHSK